MVFLDHVQNLHIHAEKTHKDFGAHCMKYVNFVHDPEKQYRSTVPAVRPLSIGLQVTEYIPRYWAYSCIRTAVVHCRSFAASKESRSFALRRPKIHIRFCRAYA